MPIPAVVDEGAGEFTIDSGTSIAIVGASNGEMRRLAELSGEFLESAVGWRIPQGEGATDNVVRLILEPSDSTNPESYRIDVSSAAIDLEASSGAGLFYGLQTLRQLARSTGNTGASIPSVRIIDAPRFGYRGMHLDVGRHMFPVSFIKKYIDLMATYKFNRFHWHLTEDQGWRIEILKYPRLTEVGAYRSETAVEKNFEPLAPYVGDGQRYGGYYTQDEIREIVEYARQRYVTIVPEIEMPGHSVAALAAYPELACTEGPFAVSTYWGVRDDIYCPSERTFEFLQDVLTEVMDLFPGEYIHIGGDEAPKVRWEESELAQDVIRREGLADEHELQSYFIRRIENFLNANGRRLIGWDEILEGGLAPEATVMSWRGMDGGIEAARQGHDVIMTPGSHVYFDHYQGPRDLEPLAIGGFSPLEKVYEFEPVPPQLTPNEASHVLGAQANVWTEYMKDSDYVEYMIMPRMLALAEVVWSPADLRNWDDFSERLPGQLAFLQSLDVNYRVPSVTGIDGEHLTLKDTITVELTSLAGPVASIRYTLDGTTPDGQSPTYTAPLRLPVDSIGTMVSAVTVMPNGRVSTPALGTYRKTALRAPGQSDRGDLQPGISYSYFEQDLRSIARLDEASPTRNGVADSIGLIGDELDEGFALVFEGFVRVPSDAVYRFDLTSDDGSRLWIGDTLVVDHDGLHSARTKSGSIGLGAGFHRIRVEYFQAGGGKSLSLSVNNESERDNGSGDQEFFYRP